MNYLQGIFVSFVCIMALSTHTFAAATSTEPPTAAQTDTYPCPVEIFLRFLQVNAHFNAQIALKSPTENCIEIKSMLLDFAESCRSCMPTPGCLVHYQEIYDSLVHTINALDEKSSLTPLREAPKDYLIGDPAVLMCINIIECIECALNTQWATENAKMIATFLIENLLIIVDYYLQKDHFYSIEQLENLNNKICLFGAYDGRCDSSTCILVEARISDLKNRSKMLQLHANNELLGNLCGELSQSIFQSYRKQRALICGDTALTDDVIPAISALFQKFGSQLTILDEFDQIYQNIHRLINDSNDDRSIKRQRKS